VQSLQASIKVKTYQVQVFRDGNKVGVCFGNDFADGLSGFGHDLPSALEDLARDVRSDEFEYESQGRFQLREELSGVFRPPAKRKTAKVLEFPVSR